VQVPDLAARQPARRVPVVAAALFRVWAIPSPDTFNFPVPAYLTERRGGHGGGDLSSVIEIDGIHPGLLQRRQTPEDFMFRLHVLELAGLALFALVTFGLVVFAHTH